MKNAIGGNPRPELLPWWAIFDEAETFQPGRLAYPGSVVLLESVTSPPHKRTRLRVVHRVA